MQEIKTFNEKRAEIYWWFSSLFAKELNQVELDKYHSAEIRSFLSDLAENDRLRIEAQQLVENRRLNIDMRRLQWVEKNDSLSAVGRDDHDAG